MNVVEKELDDPHTRKDRHTFLGHTDDFLELGNRKLTCWISSVSQRTCHLGMASLDCRDDEKEKID